ncbi:putative tricarboxylic transport TctC domain protein, partial [Vibrio parahaemolyticus V-223/04]
TCRFKTYQVAAVVKRLLT